MLGGGICCYFDLAEAYLQDSYRGQHQSAHLKTHIRTGLVHSTNRLLKSTKISINDPASLSDWSKGLSVASLHRRLSKIEQMEPTNSPIVEEIPINRT